MKLTGSQTAMLDLLRGLSAMIVLLGHCLSQASGDFSFGKQYPWQSYGVVVFFWLSGFLITYNYLHRERYAFGAYIIDRFSRIYVLFLPAVAVAILARWSFDDTLPSFADAIGNVLMLHHTPFSRILSGLPTIPSLSSPFWTVAIEWWLYMFFGIVMFWSRATGLARYVVLTLLVPASLVVGYFTLKEYVCLMWFAGAAGGAIFVTCGSRLKFSAILIVMLIAAVSLLVRLYVLSNPGTVVNMYDIQLAAVSAVLLFALVGANFKLPRLVVQLSTFLAFISYSLYLFHEPIRSILYTGHFSMGPDGVMHVSLGRAFLTVIVAFMICTGVALALENKHLMLRRWLKARLLSDEQSGTGQIASRQVA